MSIFTPVEAETLRAAVNNTIGAVSEAEHEGLIAMFKEGRAGAKALGALPEPIRSAVIGDFNTPDEYQFPEEDTLSAYLVPALAIIDAKCPAQRAEFTAALLAACTAVAEAAKGVSSSEQAVLDEVKAILS